MPKIEGLRNVTQALAKLADQTPSSGKVSVIVGYTANYAVYVHEIKDAKHTIGQWKYLEHPARELRTTLANIVKTAWKRGVKLNKALILAGLRLQRESQKIVPVDTGNLKGSAFTREEK